MRLNRFLTLIVALWCLTIIAFGNQGQAAKRARRCGEIVSNTTISKEDLSLAMARLGIPSAMRNQEIGLGIYATVQVPGVIAQQMAHPEEGFFELLARGDEQVFGATYTHQDAARYGLRVLQQARAFLASSLTRKKRVLVMGSGTGYEAVYLARFAPQAEIDAVDILPEAIAIGKANAEIYGVADRIRFIESDLLAGIPQGRSYDLVIFNAPRPVVYEGLYAVRFPGMDRRFYSRIEDNAKKDAGRYDVDGALHKRFLAQLPSHLLAGSVVLLSTDTRTFTAFPQDQFDVSLATQPEEWDSRVDSFARGAIEKETFAIHRLTLKN